MSKASSSKRPAPIKLQSTTPQKQQGKPSDLINNDGKVETLNAVIHKEGVDFLVDSGNPNYRINIKDLQVLEKLGEGQYGVVTKVLYKPTNTVMALKEIQLASGDVTARQIGVELNVLHKSKCPYIVKFYGCFLAQTSVYYCMEYMDFGSLDRVYDGGVPEPVLAKIAYAMTKGLAYMRDELNVMHRDVKPTNVLVNAAGEIKLCDFGISGQLTQSLVNSFIGCQYYMAPERINTTTATMQYGVYSDIWSLGLSLIEIATGAYPYRRFQSVFDQLQTIVYGDLPRLPAETFSKEAVDFCAQCLDKDFHRRPSYAELLRHPFLVKYDDVFVDMAAWAKDANTRHRINKGVLKLSTPFVPSPLAATGYVVAGRQPEVPTLASSFSALLLNGAASPVSSSATVNEPPSLI